jgi:hypothetical protein
MRRLLLLLVVAIASVDCGRATSSASTEDPNVICEPHRAMN